jgi:hypothetical protein
VYVKHVARRLAVLSFLAIGCGLSTATVAWTSPARTGSAPAGATARCEDGTYSYAKHRQGACSHHGGVAEWLSGSGASSSVSSGSGSSSSQTIHPGYTVFLGKRRRTSGCRLGANPDRRCSPGAYYSKLSGSILCSASFHTGSIRNVPQSEKFAVEEEYGLAPRAYGRTLEIDHIVPLELGGSNDIANLFPERASPSPGYHAKDRLENRLHSMVCSGAINLRRAQKQIATNWQALYRNVFGRAPAG